MEKFLPLFLLCFLIFLQHVYGQGDTITTTQFIKDGEFIVSSDGVFELGFFSPGETSTNRYVGIWYKEISVITPVWVANRLAPLTNKTGVLKVIQSGLVVLHNDTNATVWSTNSTRSVKNPVAQLLNTGNFVVRDANNPNPENFLWQSFDYPSDTLIAILEIVSGKKNRRFVHPDHHLNLLGHAWILHKDGRPLELVDPSLVDSCCISEVVRSIHVGLLCVQQNPEDRPSMSTVINMLTNDGVLPPPKHPGFFTQRKIGDVDKFTWSTQTPSSINEVTITLLDAR
ncbi:G-type lectin S-receptor-like serine/threonine-protein kinase At4g27290 [Lycium ferocissimum]|uniref:G-type lectin S-receptor-like serine/threonine-protein kinase At4g27290 n=1 Tax=Lycium ferocissimum TaxID=112874 RepID=UPI0028163156|nr:G-type lectin S-receptor-like serine/threonine-protein kinase At4g27290 [Lycium ferocissimum]